MNPPETGGNAERAAPLHTGGCQCGAVRYALYAEPEFPHLCHCRMCQKAFGAPFAALAIVPTSEFVWTRGAAATFLSSPITERGFCADCGTPLTFVAKEAGRTNFSICSLDDPSRLAPDLQIGVESRQPWFKDLAGLPEQTTQEAISASRRAAIVNFQHPDHETETWPDPERDDG